MQTQERYQTPPMVARTLGVTVGKVLEWVRSGKLRAVNLSEGSSRPRWKISPSDLEAFLATKSNQSQNPEPKRARREIPLPVRKWV